MSADKKRNNPTQVVKKLVVRLSDFNSLFQNVESEIGKALKTAQKQGVRSVAHFKKRVDGLVNNLNMDDLRHLASNTLNTFQDMELVEFAKVKVGDTRRQLLSALQIPSQDDVNSLSQKVVSLEKKLSTLKRHEARH
jgi:hypothetical protein